MTDDVTKRVNYFDRQFLRAGDFKLEQAYLLDRQQRLTRSLFAPGVTEGLEVTGNINSNTVTVAAGTAINANGQQIVLLSSMTKPFPVSSGTTKARIYIAYGEKETDPSTDPGITGKYTRVTENPTFPIIQRIEPGPADPEPANGVLLTEITLDNNGHLASEPNNTVRKHAGAVLSTAEADDFTVRSLTLKSDGIELGRLPKLICSQANQMALQVSDLKLDNQREIFFQGNGQIRSSNDNHKLVFNSQNNLLELHELGNISFFTGSPSPTEKMRILANGNVGIGTASLIPDTQLNVNSNAPNISSALVVSNSNADTRLGLWSGFSAGANSPAIFSTHDLRFGKIEAAKFPTGEHEGFSEAMRITSDGKVGIGTATPTNKLHIFGQDPVTIENSGEAGILFKDTRDSQEWLIGINSNGWFVYDKDYRLVVQQGSGKVGIGTAEPRNPLAIRGRGSAEELISFEDPSGATKWHINQNLGGNPPGLNFVETLVADGRLFIQAGGNVGIGTTNPTYKLDVAGAAHASSFPNSSDVRLKTNITPLTNVLDKLEQIHAISFEWNELYESLGRSTGHREIGVTAQEVDAVFPELVTSWGNEGYKAVDYGRLTGVLIEAAKELKAENEALKRRIEALETVVEQQ